MGTVSSATILNSKYDYCIRRACILLAWKTLGVDLKGGEAAEGLNQIDAFYKKYNDGIKTYGNAFKDNGLKRLTKKYEYLTEPRQTANEMYRIFKDNGLEFANKVFAKLKGNKFYYFEYEVVMALFGYKTQPYTEKQMYAGTLYAVRDFFNWVLNKKLPDYKKEAPIEGVGQEEEPENNSKSDIKVGVQKYVIYLINSNKLSGEEIEEKYGISAKLVKQFRFLNIHHPYRESNIQARTKLFITACRQFTANNNDASELENDENFKRYMKRFNNVNVMQMQQDEPEYEDNSQQEEPEEDVEMIKENFNNFYNRISKQLF